MFYQLNSFIINGKEYQTQDSYQYPRHTLYNQHGLEIHIRKLKKKNSYVVMVACFGIEFYSHRFGRNSSDKMRHIVKELKGQNASVFAILKEIFGIIAGRDKSEDHFYIVNQSTNYSVDKNGRQKKQAADMMGIITELAKPSPEPHQATTSSISSSMSPASSSMSTLANNNEQEKSLWEKTRDFAHEHPVFTTAAAGALIFTASYAIYQGYKYFFDKNQETANAANDFSPASDESDSASSSDHNSTDQGELSSIPDMLSDSSNSSLDDDGTSYDSSTSSSNENSSSNTSCSSDEMPSSASSPSLGDEVSLTSSPPSSDDNEPSSSQPQGANGFSYGFFEGIRQQVSSSSSTPTGHVGQSTLGDYLMVAQLAYEAGANEKVQKKAISYLTNHRRM